MEVVVVTDGSRSAAFHSAQRSENIDPHVGESYKITLKDEGLVAERGVFVFSHDWAALAVFFNDLAESWRGWPGTKSWASVERDLTIEARCDPGRHCFLSFTVRDGPVHSWTVGMDDISVDAGEDLTALAKSISTWAGQ